MNVHADLLGHLALHGAGYLAGRTARAALAYVDPQVAKEDRPVATVLLWGIGIAGGLFLLGYLLAPRAANMALRPLALSPQART